MTNLASLEQEALARDAEDPLAHVRERFELPTETIYLDGNSLGALPKQAARRIEQTVREEWGEGLVRSWNDAGWYELPLDVGDALAPLVGAAAGQIAVCDTTTVNLFKAIGAAAGLRGTAERQALLVHAGDFPANLYISEGASRTGSGLERVELAVDEDPAARIEELGDRLAVVALSHVNYRSGALFDLPAVTAAAHQVGALVVWDLCHSAGVIPVALDAAEVDFAVGCTYKYLNGGPGAPAWIYVARHHQATARQPLSGWMGHADPFSFEPRYRQHEGIRGFLCGTPHILSLRGVQAGLETFHGVDLAQVRRKAAQLTEVFRRGVALRQPELPQIGPADPARRGAQISFAHERGYAVVRELQRRGVIGDFRAPDVMRFGFAPLYLRHADALRAAELLSECLAEEVWKAPHNQSRATVT